MTSHYRLTACAISGLSTPPWYSRTFFLSFCLLILRLVSFHPEPCPSPLCSNIPRCRCLRASSPETMALPCCRPWYLSLVCTCIVRVASAGQDGWHTLQWQPHSPRPIDCLVASHILASSALIVQC
ncbi:hypothetical protein FVEG_16036 [Fusarium verticillioides 7600]|uniref:Uncharacterized protein n=1 Tax=Gibberella moniliformis (strain M3125 / FGSC 7600) TaxID=334819 RepID=W7M7G3_GIBM7|nr:hypothetical protein FVEG_16036 [Fusarium verticillioides 7600]EWG46916.1 hypothetical protein FVEG_16036 [Fusarium verticillioides 7600]